MSNVNDVRIKKVTVELDKTRTLLYDLNAFAEMEDRYGSIQAILDDVSKGSIKALRLVLWAGLIHEDDSLSPYDVGKWIKFADIARVSELLGKALELTQPTPEQEELLSPLDPQ